MLSRFFFYDFFRIKPFCFFLSFAGKQTAMRSFFSNLPQDIQSSILDFLSLGYQCLGIQDFWLPYSFACSRKKEIHADHNIPLQCFLDFVTSRADLLPFHKDTDQNEARLLSCLMTHKIKSVHLYISTRWKKHTEKHHHEYWETYRGKIHIDFENHPSMEVDHDDFVSWYAKRYVDYELQWEAHDGGYKDY